MPVDCTFVSETVRCDYFCIKDDKNTRSDYMLCFVPSFFFIFDMEYDLYDSCLPLSDADFVFVFVFFYNFGSCTTQQVEHTILCFECVFFYPLCVQVFACMT